MRGVSLRSFSGPGISALNSCMPPTPSIGRIATAITMIPMPPYHCSACRQTLTDCGRCSIPLSTVAPVVVRPAIDSKQASVKLRPGISSSSGAVPASDISSQPSTTSNAPSRGSSSRR